jgi:5-methylcytosine-specific restriction endonuclease McrA
MRTHLNQSSGNGTNTSSQEPSDQERRRRRVEATKKWAAKKRLSCPGYFGAVQKRFRDRHKDALKLRRNKGKNLESSRRYRMLNRDKVRLRAKRYRDAHRGDERLRAAKREYRRRWWASLSESAKQQFRDKWRPVRLKSQRKSKLLNPQKILTQARIRNARRRALKRATCGAPSHVAAFMKRTLSRDYVHCYYCENRVSTKHIHFDHVQALSKGGSHEVSNICVSCARCNLKKHDKSLNIWQPKQQQFLPL